MSGSQRDRLVRYARSRPIFTRGEVTALGIHPSTLARLEADGIIERVSRGNYHLADAEITEHHALALAAAAVPSGVVCLLSALEFHGIGTQLPDAVWMAVNRRTWKPQVSYPPLRIVYFTGEALISGIERHAVERRPVRIYGLAKTIADCFSYRNVVGLDVALEALTESWRSKRVRMPEIERYARICRVQNVMRPYLETLVA